MEVGINYDVYIDINNATLTSTNTAALVLSPECHTTIRNSTLRGHTGIYYKAGELAIEDCTIEATGTFAENPISEKTANTTQGSGIYFDGSGILVDSNNKFNKTLPITISGNSSVTSANGFGIREIGGREGSGVSMVELSMDNIPITGPKGDVALLTPAQ